MRAVHKNPLSLPIINSTNKDKQVKSKKRVTDHGEVYTAGREVNAMLDLMGGLNGSLILGLVPFLGDRSAKLILNIFTVNRQCLLNRAHIHPA